MMPAWHPHTLSSGLSFNGWSFKKQPWLIPFISVLIQINTDRMTWVESYYMLFILFLVGRKLLYNIVMAFTIHQHESAISSVSQFCSTLCDSMDCSMPGFLVHHRLLGLAQTHVHRVCDAIQPSHPLPSIFPSIRFFSNESVFHIRWPKYWSFSFTVLPMNIQDWFPLGLTGLISLLSKGLSRVFSNSTVQKHQF